MKLYNYIIPFCFLFAVERVYAIDVWNTNEFAHDINRKDTQASQIMGKVIDATTKSPLANVTITVKGHDIKTTTNDQGDFILKLNQLKLPLTLIVSLVGYDYHEEIVDSFGFKTINLSSSQNELDEVQVVAYGTQRKITSTGSISSVKTEDLLKSPSGSVGNALSGALTGVSSVQSSGQPGAEDPVIYVRGTGSLSDEMSRPLILVDGVERSFFQMDPNEIESVNVLKDAASTAVFGVRGANGVILVTTRRGKSGKPSISLSSQFGLTQTLRNLTGVDSYNYAKLYTEAQRSDNPSIKDEALSFSPFITEMFKLNADPIMFPNVDWNDYIFNNLGWQTQHNLTLSGGAERVRYFISQGFMKQDGMLKQFYESYDPNFKYDRYNYRANVDVDLTNTTLLKVNIGGRIGNRTEPVAYDNLWSTLLWTVPFSSPGFVDGKHIILNESRAIPLEGIMSGLDTYYNWGYTNAKNNELNLDLSLDQKLDFLTKGLRFNVKGAYNTTYLLNKRRTPTGGDSAYGPIYLGFMTQPGMDISDPRFDNTIVYRTEGVSGLREPMTYADWSSKSRNWYLESSLNYQKQFGLHEITGLLLYNQSKFYYPSTFTGLPTAYVGYVGRVTYNWNRRYLADFNAGLNGSENFAPDKRYGFFPAGSLGWVISEENFMKELGFINSMKLRASYGLVGNDKAAQGNRFMYLSGSWNGSHSVLGGLGSYQFGDRNTGALLPDAKENTIGNPEVTWEKVTKQNYGIDAEFLERRLSLTADVFFERRRDILSTRNTLPSISAISLPLINLGIVNNHGYELSLGWNSNIKTVNYWLKTNLSYSKNRIIYMDEVRPNEPYMAQTGRSTGLTRGYLFDRFLQKNDFDVDDKLKRDGNGDQILPVMALGNPKPGDALFRDLNNDGVIDGNDITYFGHSWRPDYILGLMAGFNWNNIGFSMQWTAGINASRVISDVYRDPYGSTNSRALMQFLADGRWHEGNQENARFPRLTFDNKVHYLQDSDLWLVDASYLRLKTAELSYTIKDNFHLKKLGIGSLKLYSSGYNLLTLFSDLNDMDIDPEGQTSGSVSYPNTRIFNFGMNVTF